MISVLSGRLLEMGASSAVVSCSGVGFYVNIPSSVLGSLPEVGGECTLYTHLAVREDALELYGFESARQREIFRRLIGVTGVGPKSALAILSLYDADRIALSVAAGDHKAFTACAGVGPKLAQRIVLELKDKLGGLASGLDSVSAAPLPQAPASAEALAALVSLGFSNTEAAEALAKQPPELSAEELITRSLKLLAKR
ncbi:MAG: Holliday junction branch migration protein RuvA [Oscillospiraceae bacterium]|nr:Holliday junction branch migration protein RuvA [Oscillospiraceae bacterium]